MDIRWLEGFVVVAEELHFSNAANRLGIAQSPLSQLIRKLEKELGQSLFSRSTRSVELTAAGKALLPEARRILATMSEARELVSAAEGDIVGTVRLGYSGVLNYSTLPLLTKEVQNRLPLVDLELVGQKLTQEALNMLRQGRLDIAMLGLPINDPDVETWSQINSFVNGRVRLANSAVNTYGVSLLGKQITWIGNGGLGHIYDNLKETYNYVDCSYIKLLLEGGVLSFLLIIIGYTLAGRKAAKEGNIYLCMALAFIAIYSIIEPRLCEIGFNPFLLVLVILVDYRGIFLMNHQKKETMFRKKIQLCNVKNP